ncbi:MAG: CHAT domain-containing protein, partial [Chloroflexota bacterium]|nr:CHAT domain-containing protein [Chloroflexota bacterium]
MPTLTTTIQQIDPASSQYLAVTQRDNGQEVCRHTFAYAPGLLVNLEPQWMLDKAVPRQAADVNRSADPAAQQEQAKVTQQLREYGRRLYAYLFGDGADLAAFLKYSDDNRSPLRLILSMHGSAAPLWQLPWEYLHDGADFLALNGRFQISRRPEGLGELAIDPVALPLRILVIIAAPDDQHLLDTEEEIGVIQDALDEVLRAELVQVAYVDDATLDNIGEQLRSFRPHVLHYTGHGAYDQSQARSFLVLEDDNGQSRPAGIGELRPHLQHAPDLRLVLLSGCQTAQTSALDAFSGVATGLLQANVPAVLAMQFSILDSSAIKLAGAFYRALARGDSLSEALSQSRIALWQFDAGPGYDWGIPALYLRTPDLRLVDAASARPNLAAASSPAALINVEGLPLPRHFVGRKSELRQLRRALGDNGIKSLFLRGIGGIGKSSSAAKLIQRPGHLLDGVCVIRCHETDALDIPGKLASFLQGRGEA